VSYQIGRDAQFLRNNSKYISRWRKEYRSRDKCEYTPIQDNNQLVIVPPKRSFVLN
jgi:hypothetical protein